MAISLWNIGDMLEFWSEGLFKSTRHRVLNAFSKSARYSVPFFCNCDFDAPLTRLNSSDDISISSNIKTAGEYIMEKLNIMHDITV